MPRDSKQEGDGDLACAAAELERARDKFSLSMSAVEREVAHTLDWREWVQRRPGLALGLAFAVGAFLGRRVGRRR
jgi:hypothetical protein